MKVVVNRCYGGFGLSRGALKVLGMSSDEYWLVENTFEFRSSKELVEAVEKYGTSINGAHADLTVIEIPDDAINPYVDEYDGIETIREGRSW